MAHEKNPYLCLSRSLRATNKRYKLTEYKQVLVLEEVLASYEKQTRLYMLDLLLLNEIASQATIHSIAKSLIGLKLIKSETSKADMRRKYLLPTALGLSWLNDCEKLLKSSATHRNSKS